MIKLANSVLDGLSKFVEKNPTLVNGLIGGGLGAVGGAVTGNLVTEADPDESPSDAAKRKLKNALVLGTLGAGAGGLLGAGATKLQNADERPLSVANLLFNKGTTVGAAGVAGGAGGYMFNNWKNGKAWEVAAKKLTEEAPKDARHAKQLINQWVNGIANSDGTTPRTVGSNISELATALGADKTKLEEQIKALAKDQNAFHLNTTVGSTTDKTMARLADAFGLAGLSNREEEVLSKLNRAGIKVTSNNPNLKHLASMSGTNMSKFKRLMPMAIPALAATGLAGYGVSNI